jgi:outer membrane protein OmpA-like peptidoglycan-associated protein
MSQTCSVRFFCFFLPGILSALVCLGQTKPSSTTASIEGSVVDAATRQPVVGATISIKNQNGGSSSQQQVGPDGGYRFTVDSRQSYMLTNKADGYEPLEESIVFTSTKVERLQRRPTLLYRIGTKPAQPTSSPAASAPKTTPAPVASTSVAPKTTPPVSEQPAVSNSSAPVRERVTPTKTLDAKVTYTPPLIVAPAGKTTQLPAIQFVQSKAELLPNAQPALEQLLEFMRGKPTVEIELAGHTDNQGDFDENLRLSKQRVDLVKDYLVKNGITANRVSTRGYGPTRPIASNNSEATRQLNRRVEMTVVKE